MYHRVVDVGATVAILRYWLLGEIDVHQVCIVFVVVVLANYFVVAQIKTIAYTKSNDVEIKGETFSNDGHLVWPILSKLTLLYNSPLIA